MDIYLAGRMSTKWRSKIVPDFDDIERRSLLSDWQWPIGTEKIFSLHNLVGPYSAYNDKHFMQHGYASSSQKDILRLDMRAIANADLVFAWIEDYECYGTLAEVGYAAGLRKRIYIGFSSDMPSDDDAYEKETRRIVDADMEGDMLDLFSDYGSLRELWFASRMATRVAVGYDDPAAALIDLIGKSAMYLVPPKASKGRCRTCNALLIWGKNENDRTIPLDARTLTQDEHGREMAQLHFVTAPKCGRR